MQSRFSPHLFQGSCLPYAPPLCVFLALLLARAQHISTSKTQNKQTQAADRVLVLVLLASPPPFPAAWALGARIQSPRIQICAPMPTRHPPWPTIINRPTLARDAGHAMPYHTIPCHPHSGPMAQWRQSVSELLRVKSQASRGHTIRLGHFQKYYPARTAITTSTHALTSR